VHAEGWLSPLIHVPGPNLSRTGRAVESTGVEDVGVAPIGDKALDVEFGSNDDIDGVTEDDTDDSADGDSDGDTDGVPDGVTDGATEGATDGVAGCESDVDSDCDIDVDTDGDTDGEGSIDRVPPGDKDGLEADEG
jgi:hypothetical protein